jgi:DNA invertase Pin-like site-specific DNA recombinase
MPEPNLRVALLGQVNSLRPEAISSQKERLREEARKRNYVIVDEFWEEDLPEDALVDERDELKRFMNAVWMDELHIDGIFLEDLASLGWESRTLHVSLMMLFERHDIAIITREQTYYPQDWLVGLTL